MRLPPSVRYLPSRLQVALNPWLWLGILLTGIVGLYAWEYRQNPGQLPWQISAKAPKLAVDASSSTDVSRESLTADEEAIAAELDNVELLLTQLESDVTDLTTGGEASAAASLNASTDGDAPSESNVDRLNRYIDEYSFLGTKARGTNVQTELPQTLLPGQETEETVSKLQQNTELGQTTSALADALNRLEQTTLVNPTTGSTSRNPVPSANTPNNNQGVSTSIADAEEGTVDDTNNAAATSFSFDQLDQSGVTTGSIEGLNRTFIRTTPNMSPPPGTTGYVPPASLSDFNRLNQPSDASSFGAQPSLGSFGTNTPSVGSPNRSQVLPPAIRDNAAPLDTPTFDNSPQVNQNQPRNAWENFWD